MKKSIGCFMLILAFVLFAPIVNAQCPAGKSPVTMVTPSGQTRTLCINDNAVQGIDNAADNSSTTVVTASCTKGCWTPIEVEYWSSKGELTCSWVNRYELVCKNIPLVGEKTVVFHLITESTDPNVATCSLIDHLDETKITDEKEIDACVALLEPYTSSTCPCAEAYREVISSLQPTDTLECIDQEEYYLDVTAGSRDMISYYPGSFAIYGKQTCGIDNTSLRDITDDEAQSCIDFLNIYIRDNRIICL